MQALRPVLRRARGLIRQIDVITALPQPTLSSPGSIWFSHPELGSLLLTESDAQEYRDTLNALVEWAAKHRAGAMSAREVAKHLQRAILEALDIPGGSGQTSLQKRTATAVETLEQRLTCPAVNAQRRRGESLSQEVIRDAAHASVGANHPGGRPSTASRPVGKTATSAPHTSAILQIFRDFSA